MEEYPRGLRGRTRNALGVVDLPAWVQIPPSPPYIGMLVLYFCDFNHKFSKNEG